MMGGAGMHERLRIHHGVGSRVLLDSDQLGVSFSCRRTEDEYVFEIPIDRGQAVDEVLRLKDEVNVFIFKEIDGAAVEKVWFYTGDGRIEYSDDNHCLTIVATARITYKPGDMEP